MSYPLFDAHCHIIDPRFPLVPNQGYLPPAYTAEEYLTDVSPLGIQGGAVVSGSFQAFDQTYLLAALDVLGPSYVGVTQLPETAEDETILALDAAGVRAVRFNLRRGGSAELEVLKEMAYRLYEVAGWHIELYVDSRDLSELKHTLSGLPRIVIDHLGLSAEGLPHLLDLVEQGAWVKATGFGRVDLDIPNALERVMSINPDKLLFGTDLPSTRATRPFMATDIALIQDTLGKTGTRKVLHDNALELYRPEKSA
jgi:predicted TIM-barrel fold metal-dependent hydrolase